MYLQHASGLSITLFIQIFWVNFTFRCQNCSHSGRTPFRPPFLKVQFFKNMNAYASVPKNGLFIHKFFFFVRSNEFKHQKNEILWLDLNHSSIQNLAQVARNRDFLQPQATHCGIGTKWDMTFILHSYETSSFIFSHFTHYKKGGGKGCAHDTCKVLMGSKMWENDKKLSVFRMSIWVLPPFRPPFL